MTLYKMVANIPRMLIYIQLSITFIIPHHFYQSCVQLDCFYSSVLHTMLYGCLPHQAHGSYTRIRYMYYHEVPKFSDARKLCCNLPKIQTKRTKLRVFYQKDANGKANSEDPDQTAPLGAV